MHDRRTIRTALAAFKGKKGFFVFVNRSYPGEFEAEFKKALARESGAKGVWLDEKKPRVENLVTLSFLNGHWSEIIRGRKMTKIL
jgi:hypothetical protein